MSPPPSGSSKPPADRAQADGAADTRHAHEAHVAALVAQLAEDPADVEIWARLAAFLRTLDPCHVMDSALLGDLHQALITDGLDPAHDAPRMRQEILNVALRQAHGARLIS